MRMLMTLLAITCLALPAMAEPSTCNHFQGANFEGSIEIGEQGHTAVVELRGETNHYEVSPCGMWSISYCGTNPKDADDTITLAFVTGRLTATDDPTADFVLLNGLYQLKARCGT